VFSETKTPDAAAVLAAVDRRELGLDDTVERWWPPLPRAGPTTVRGLLDHSAGLPDYAFAPAYLDAVRDRPADPWTVDEIVRCALERPAPEGWRYSNTHYWLLGSILEAVTGLALPPLLARDVFERCGAEAARYPALAGSITGAGYSTLWAGPAGAAWASATDLARMLRALTRGLVSSDLVEEMWRGVDVGPTTPLWKRPQYGLGLMIDDRPGVGGTGGHGGDGPGYRSFALTARDHDVAVALIAEEPVAGAADAAAVRLLERAITG
jgi:D-alanyl-D-alanine carboxypeptidase